MGSTGVVITNAILVMLWVMPAILATYALFINAADKWPLLREDFCIQCLAFTTATPILALLWPAVFMTFCSVWLEFCALSSCFNSHEGDENAWYSSIWYGPEWTRIKTGHKRKIYMTEDIPAGYSMGVKSQIAANPRLKIQPELVRTGNGQDTGISNHDSSHLSLQVEKMNGGGMVKYAHRSCQTDQDTPPPTYQMVLDESVDRAAIPDGRTPPPVYSA
ncbi:hypothetical protein BHE90_012750 [Fusarium euwallaceae]|uniref:Uncharacterized protein n=1 Tax=Fusarium euwallaceae TaxID=1147111 RepID=A0A430LAQ5_9HYPO|nr:hypothetical protein BHE90_012750 [Fusarium euwallaceae]